MLVDMLTQVGIFVRLSGDFGVEADDICGILAKKFATNHEIIISSADKDF